jgi:malate dehydrogenase (oxaloacetate-decarboxylating)
MLTRVTNTDCITWGLSEAVAGRDIFIGVSAPWVLTKEMVQSMAPDPIIMAMANPIPEIMPELAKEAWAKIVATGRSDYPNQINNVSVFPGIFKWALKYRVENITDEMKLKAAENLAWAVKNPTVDEIIPSPLDKSIVDIIAESVNLG